MNKFKTPMIAAAVLTGLALIGSLMNSHPSILHAAGGPTVTIDPSQLPLHVTGSTTVAGTVATTQSGVWNVGIAGNSAANPFQIRDVDGPNRQPFQRVFSLPPGPSGCGANFCTLSLGTVPAGKFLVLTHLQGELALVAGNSPLGVNVVNPGGVRLFSVPRSGLTCYNDTLSVSQPTRCPFNQEFRVILNAGDQAFIDTDTSGSYPLGVPQNFVISGYYVDAPPSATPLLRHMTEPSAAEQPAAGYQRRPVTER